MYSSISSAKNQCNHSLEVLNLTAESLSTFNIRAMSVLTESNCFNQLFLVCPDTPFKSQPWVFYPFLSHAVSVLVQLHVQPCPHLIEAWLSSWLYCSPAFATMDLDAITSPHLTLLSLDLTLICRLTSRRLLIPASSLWACGMSWAAGWPQLPTWNCPACVLRGLALPWYPLIMPGSCLPALGEQLACCIYVSLENI